jgi:hypothetical protein
MNNRKFHRHLRKKYRVDPPMSDAEGGRLGAQAARPPGTTRRRLSVVPGGEGAEVGLARRGPSPGLAERVDTAIERIVASHTATAHGVRRYLEEEFSRFGTRIVAAEATVTSLKIEFQNRVTRALESQESLADSKAQIAASGESADRRLGTPLYVGVLVTVGLFSAWINESALQIFRDNYVATILAALFFAGVFGLGVHQVGLGLTDRSQERWLRLGAGLTVLGGLLLASYALAQIRGEYLAAVGKPANVAQLLWVQGAADIIGIAASIFHANVHADELRRAERRLEKDQDAALETKDKILSTEALIKALRQERAAAVAACRADICALEELAKQVVATFLAVLVQLLSSVDAAVIKRRKVDDFVARTFHEWESWLEDPSDDERPGGRKALPSP